MIEKRHGVSISAHLEAERTYCQAHKVMMEAETQTGKATKATVVL